MLSLRLFRRLCTVSSGRVNVAAIASSPLPEQAPGTINQPALVKLKNERDPEKLYELFKANAHNRVVIENRFAFEDVVSRLAGAGRRDYIENLLEHQKTLPQGRREGFIVRVIMLYGSAGMAKHAVDTFRDMHLYGCRRTVKSFNAALNVLAQSHDMDSVERFVTEAPIEFGIKMDVVSVNTVMKAFCEMGEYQKAFLVMSEMEKLGISPDVITYTTLISASYKAHTPETAAGLWNLMVLKRCPPNVATFNARILFLVNKGRAWEANKLLAFMRWNAPVSVSPDEVTYILVIKGFFKVGNVSMALRVYSEFLYDGLRPNQKMYQTMVHYLCKAGDFDLAFSMCRESLQRNWFLNVDTIVCLLECLQKGGKVEEAECLYRLAGNRVPSFSPAKVAAMKAILTVK